MARVTIEDCLKNVPNRFELAILATKRARELERGALASIPKQGDKNTVIALREIAHWTNKAGAIHERTVVGLQNEVPEVDEPEETEMQFPKHLVNKSKKPNQYKNEVIRGWQREDTTRLRKT